MNLKTTILKMALLPAAIIWCGILSYHGMQLTTMLEIGMLAITACVLYTLFRTKKATH